MADKKKILFWLDVYKEQVLMSRVLILIILLAMFFTSCGDDGSGVNSFEQTPETSLLVDDANSSSSVDVLPSSAMVNESSSSENLDESSSSAESSSSEKKELLSSSAEKEKSSSSEVLDESSSSMKNENSSSSVKTAESSSAEIFNESSSSVKNESSSSSVKTEISLSSEVSEKSSSSQEIEISSSVVYSSSVISTVMSIYDAENNILTDLRDSHVYKTVIIGEQVWMAENLNYKYKAGTSSFCYNDSTKYCNLYGRLYTYDVRKIQICPEGWHLPDSLEWQMLFDNTENKNGFLKAESNWREWDGMDMGGTNEYEFSAYAAGYKSKYSSKYYGMSESAQFSVSDKSRVIRISMYNENAPLYRPDEDYMAVSVRCIKDSE